MSKQEPIMAVMDRPVATHDVVIDAIRTMRAHLGMEIGYLSEFVGDDLVFRAVDAPGLEHLAEPGDTRSRSETYCNHIVSGDLPQMMADTLDYPIAAALPITRSLPIRAHISVPIERIDGSIYGMFCCLSPHPNTTLNDRDLATMRSFARLVQAEVQRALEQDALRKTALETIHAVVEQQSFKIVYQPIFSLATGALTGVEALCRFEAEPYRPPNIRFEEAGRVGLSEMLEICVMEPALLALEQLPAGVYLSLNASPQTVCTGLLAMVFAERSTKHLVLEVTEHVRTADWSTLEQEIQILRDMGVQVAIDDAGSGYSGLQQMVRLNPDIIKLDRSLVSGIDNDAALRALCSAMVYYASETGAALVAEGIERDEEAQVLRDLGVERGQGYLLGRPVPIEDIVATFGTDRAP
ncbi:diguanylate phosphodiesterase [Jannaschia sp. EhC01]|nr:diguanylate phosphodiesterase [Jannaschia sp. EhC01]